MTPLVIPEWRQTEIRKQLLTEARRDCWCEKARKPCPEHDAYDDGILDTLATLTAPDEEHEHRCVAAGSTPHLICHCECGATRRHMTWEMTT